MQDDNVEYWFEVLKRKEIEKIIKNDSDMTNCLFNNEANSKKDLFLNKPVMNNTNQLQTPINNMCMNLICIDDLIDMNNQENFNGDDIGDMEMENEVLTELKINQYNQQQPQ